jgi:hypothetical protein
VVGHAGARLLTDLPEVTGLQQHFSLALAGLRQRDSGRDPGRVAVDVAVMLADGGETIADLAVLRDQPACSVRWPPIRPRGGRYGRSCTMLASTRRRGGPGRCGNNS